MTNTTATVHNPSNFEPKDYVVVDYLDNKRPEYYRGMTIEQYELEIKMWKADFARIYGPQWRSKIHRCVHCGNGNVRWITAVLHKPTGEVVTFGSDCTDRLGFENHVAFKLAQIQARAEARQVRFTIYNKREEFLNNNPAIREALANIEKPEHAKNTFVRDVLNKLDQYGELSARQVECVISSMKRDQDFAARRAAEATEVKGDAPTGRVAVTGVVLSVQERETDFGIVLKMLVKLENNSKVWVSVPRSSNVNRNDTITFKATFEVSRDDKSFAFGKRPTIINHVPAQVQS